MAHSLGYSVLMLLVSIEGLKAFSYHESDNFVRKSSNENYDYILEPEFSEDGRFAYVRVKKLDRTPPMIEVLLDIYDKDSTRPASRAEKFQADTGSTSINVTSIKFGRTIRILSINEQRANGESKDMLIRWAPFGYFDPNLYLPANHIVVGNDWDFDVIVNDNATCQSFSGKCRYRFQEKANPVKTAFFDNDLVWPSMHIARVGSSSSEFFIRGFDSAGKYEFLQCGTEGRGFGDCKKLLSLTNASSLIQTHSLDSGVCFIAWPGKDKSARCLKYDEHMKRIIFDATVTYQESNMSLLDAIDSSGLDYYSSYSKPDIILAANRIHCVGIECFDIVLSRMPRDSSKPIVHRHLALDCSENDKLFNVRLSQPAYSKSLIIEYVCENDVGFAFKSLNTNNG